MRDNNGVAVIVGLTTDVATIAADDCCFDSNVNLFEDKLQVIECFLNKLIIVRIALVVNFIYFQI